MKVQKVFDVRWVFSSFVAVKSVLHDFAALYEHFSAKSDCHSSSTSKEKSKFNGLARKLQSFNFVGETCILKEDQVSLKQLSLTILWAYMPPPQTPPSRHFVVNAALRQLSVLYDDFDHDGLGTQLKILRNMFTGSQTPPIT